MQKEKEELHKKILDLQRKLDAKQALELEIQHMRGALQVMEHMGEDVEVKKKMEEIKLKLKDKVEDLEAMQDLYKTLVVKERETNDVLQDARTELIKVCVIFRAQGSLMLLCPLLAFQFSHMVW